MAALQASCGAAPESGRASKDAAEAFGLLVDLTLFRQPIELH
jgi:hypothetical protein